jgi:hypothetical protein
MSLRLLVDGDVIANRAAFATEKTKYLVVEGSMPDGAASVAFFDDAKTAKAAALPLGSDAIWSRKELQPEDQATLIADVMIRDIEARYAEENPTLLVYLSGVGNYRHSIATRQTYKGHRGTRPTHLPAVRHHIEQKYKAKVSFMQEADDEISQEAARSANFVIISIDKDFMTIPGRHYNFVTKEEVTVSAKEACFNFYSQVLGGDAADNIPGAPGVGPTRARKALLGCKSPLECWQRTLEVYINAYDSPELGAKYALETAQLVYLPRTKGEAWCPPQKP